MTKKKAFFREATKTEVKRKKFVSLKELGGVKNLTELIDSNNYTVIPCHMPRGYDSPEKFMKHATEVKPMRTYSLAHALTIGKTPVQLREEAFNKLNHPFYCCYSIKPFGVDSRTRKIPLTECVEGARIKAFSHQVKGEEIEVRPYDEAKAIWKEGVEILVHVPSRTEEKEKYEILLSSVPIIDCREKYALSLKFDSDHVCKSKRFKIRYRYEDEKIKSKVVNICAHEIAGYLEVIDFFWNEKKNDIPLQMSQFAIPTQDTVDFYLTLERNVLIYDSSLKTKDKLRKPNRADKEIELWNRVRELKHDRTFFARKNRDGNVRDYNWRFS